MMGVLNAICREQKKGEKKRTGGSVGKGVGATLLIIKNNNTNETVYAHDGIIHNTCV